MHIQGGKGSECCSEREVINRNIKWNYFAHREYGVGDNLNGMEAQWKF